MENEARRTLKWLVNKQTEPDIKKPQSIFTSSEADIDQCFTKSNTKKG